MLRVSAGCSLLQWDSARRNHFRSHGWGWWVSENRATRNMVCTVFYASSVIILRLAWFKVLILNRRNMSNQLGDYFDVRFNISLLLRGGDIRLGE